jgi:hypothetical protein
MEMATNLYGLGGVLKSIAKAFVKKFAQEAGEAAAKNLAKQLASEEGVAEILAGGGRMIAGPGTKTPIREVGRLVSDYGGSPEQWVKVTSTAKGHLQTHAYRNIVTGEVVDLKSILP